MAKKAEEIKEKKDKLQESLAQMNKKYGVGTVLTIDTRLVGVYNIIPTGSLGFDYKSLTIGGFAKGRLYEIMGWEGSCKTTICIHAVAECQKQGGNVLYIDAEFAMNEEYFRKLGVDLEKLIICHPSSGEEGFVIAMEMIKTGQIDLVVIDSDSAMLPKSVMDGEIGESAIGKKARLNSNAYPKLKPILYDFNTCMIVISQYREKIGVMFGNPTTTQGGHALKFTTDCRIEISRTVIKDIDGEKNSCTVKVNPIKYKLGSAFKTSKFDIIFGQGIDVIGELIDLSVEYDIVKQSGSWYSYGETKLGQGTIGLRTLFNDNPELCAEIRQQIINKITHIENVLITTPLKREIEEAESEVL